MPQLWQLAGPQGGSRAVVRVQGVGLGQDGSPVGGQGEEHVGRCRQAGRGRNRRGREHRRQRLERHLEGCACEGFACEGFARANLTGFHLDEAQPGLMPAAADWITLAEAAGILAAANVHFTPATIGSWARAGRLQSIKLGGRRFVRRGEVRALIAGPRRVGTDDVQPRLFEDLRG
jgi:hypothetical protein